jgi:RND family efflux transporter MFP subunit
MKKRLLLLSMFLLSTSLLVGCSKEEVEEVTIRPINAVQIGGMDAFVGRWFPGKAKAVQEVNMSFRVPGTLSKFPVNLGDELTKGSLLAQLDKNDYQVELKNAQAQLQEVQASVDLAETEFKRVDNIRLKDPGAVSQSMVEVRRGQLNTAIAQLSSAQAAVTRAKDNLSYTTIKAPFTGTVVEKFVENFEDVQAKQQIVRMVDTQQIEFIVQIPESMMLHASEVVKAFVVFDAQPDLEIPATVKEIGKEASQTTRTYPVTLIMEQPKEFQLLAGMAGKARADQESVAKIDSREESTSVEIPLVAVFSDQGNNSYVWVIDETSNQVARRQVEVGSLTDTGVLVKGLNTGEWIATAGVNTLVEDQQVRILK